MSIFDSFLNAGKPAPIDTTQQPGINAPLTVVPASTVNTAPQGVAPADPSNPGSPLPADTNIQPSPIDQYKELWQNAPIDPNAPAPAEVPSVDPKTLAERVSTINFARSVTPDILTKVAAGGEDAAAALVEAMNLVARDVMLQSTLVGNKLSQNVAAFEANQVSASVPDLIKQHAVSDTIQAANPAFNNPAIKPLMNMVQDQLRLKHPNATAAELANLAQGYLTAVTETVSPTPAPAADAATEDWSSFLTQTNPFAGQ